MQIAVAAKVRVFDKLLETLSSQLWLATRAHGVPCTPALSQQQPVGAHSFSLPALTSRLPILFTSPHVVWVPGSFDLVLLHKDGEIWTLIWIQGHTSQSDAVANSTASGVLSDDMNSGTNGWRMFHDFC